MSLPLSLRAAVCIVGVSLLACSGDEGGGDAAAGSGGGAAGQAGQDAAGSVSQAGTGGASGTAGVPASGGGTGEHFSFFVTSWAALQRVSKSPNGFGGDLRYGEADGLTGADKICREIAEAAMAGAGKKTWRAFLSVTKGSDGKPVNAIDRVGDGPWYDRLGRLIAQNKTALAMTRPQGADSAIINDLPNEDGVPNHAPDGMQVDNHDMLTGTSETGQLFSTDWKYTCHDWTSAVGSDGTPRVGHSWPRSGGGGGRMGGGMSSGANWMSALNEAGCAAGASLVEMGPPNASNPTVGSGGGYGGFYCLALEP
ncbi:MAG TPA: hypothetical protein VJV78_07200 [Polyangiales bacterium]|nr:hypothetical protein [Polyangiales bacterium]